MKVSIVGTGLIGGSLALGLKDGHELRGWDEDPSALRTAAERGAIEPASDLNDAVRGADVVVLAVPVDLVPRLCWALAPAVEAHAVVTDVGSAKTQVVVEAESVFGPRFVGGHPMAGSESHGIGSARGDLFEDAWWILTPTEGTAPDAYGTVAGLVREVGARPVAVAPDAHDALIARLSHVPQLAASAIVETAVAAGEKDALLGLAGPGFRDVTRIAGSDPDLWVSILRSNRRSVLEALDGLTGRLSELGKLIARDRWEEVHDFLAGARRARSELWAKPLGGELQTFGLGVLVPDRPGVLAEVTTQAGTLGVNIEDLRIVHSTEGGRGRLEVLVAGANDSDRLAGALTALGYHVEPIGWE